MIYFTYFIRSVLKIFIFCSMYAKSDYIFNNLR